MQRGSLFEFTLFLSACFLALTLLLINVLPNNRTGLNFNPFILTGIIGFAGVILAQLLNGFLNRRQYEHEMQRQRNALMSSLLAELRHFDKIFKNTALTDGKEKENDFRVARNKRYITEEELGSLKILDDADLVEAILQAIITIDEVDRTLAMAAKGEVNNVYSTLYPDQRLSYHRIHRTNRPVISDAVEKLERAIAKARH